MNLLPLDTFRSEFGYSPWHWWGLTSTARFPTNAQCNDLVYQYAWQANDSAGRDDVRQAIETAEARLREHLRFSVAPHYVIETLPVPRWYDGRLNRLQYTGADGRFLSLQLSEGKIQAIGTETRTLIASVSGVSLVISDADGDGLNDTFTATVGTLLTDVSQIEIMFAAADRWTGEPAGDKWAIKPVNITISGGTATIKGRIWQIVKPVLFESGQPIDPSTASNYATTLEVYRHYCNPDGQTNDTAQALLVWETRPFPYFAAAWFGAPPLTQNSADPASVAYAIARIGLRDADKGIVEFGAAVYDATSAQWVTTSLTQFPPDRIIVRYLAGDALDSRGLMQEKWAKATARLAAAELGKRVCACESASRMIYEQQVDHSFSGDARVEKFTMSQDDNLSPFGYKEGQLQAWRIVRNQRQLVGVLG